jgi:hypothetical protein
MIRTRWTAVQALAVATALALPLSGCYAELEGEAFGEGSVEGETHRERHYAATETVSIDYSAGMDVLVESHLGNVRVVRGNASAKVEVTFSAFIDDTELDDAAAEAQIDQELDLTVEANGAIVIAAAREAGASAQIGADIEVRLPADFAGDFQIDQVDGAVDVDLRGTTPTSTTIETTGRGDVRVIGAGGELAVETAIGNVTIDVATWSSDDGYVHVNESGNIVIQVAAGANGSMSVAAQGGLITEPATLPTDWSKSDDCDESSGTYFLGAGTGATVDVWTHSGSITLGVSAAARAHGGF